MELQTEVLLPTSHNCNKICDILGFLNQNTGNFASSEKKMPFKRMHAMAYTVQLHCPISAAIRTADCQSDLRILLYR